MLADQGTPAVPYIRHRSEMTGADQTWAARYNTGDVWLYTTGSKAYGIATGSYATVQLVDDEASFILIETAENVWAMAEKEVGTRIDHSMSKQP